MGRSERDRLAVKLPAELKTQKRKTTQENDPAAPSAPRKSKNVLIVGESDLGKRIAKFIEDNPHTGRWVCGFLDDQKPLKGRIIGRTRDLAQLARKKFVDELILSIPHDRDLTLRILREAKNLHLDVKMAPDLFGCQASGEVEQVGGVTLIPLHEERLPVVGLVFKRALDVALAAALLFLLAPALALIAILVRVSSPGPVLYSAQRAGRKGRPFRCHKFRTMIQDADAMKGNLREFNQRQGPIFKIVGDPRITPVGLFRRRYSLDELPQLFGLWQVTSRRDPSFKTGLSLDIQYIHRWSIGMDLRILLRTAGAILRGSGD